MAARFREVIIVHRPTQRQDALRERVFAGRLRQETRRRRAAVARKGGRKLVALFAGLGMVAGLLTVTQLASSALEEGDGALGANDCAPPVAVETVVEDVSTDEDLEVHIEEDEEGNVHHHYRKKRDRGGEPEPAPAPTEAAPDPEECEGEGDGGEDGDGSGGESGEGGDGDEGDSGDEGDGDGSGGEGDGDGGDEGDGDGGGGEGDGDDGTNPGGRDGDNNGLDVLGRTCSNSDLPRHTGFIESGPRCVDTQFGEVPEAAKAPSLLITEFPDWVGTDESFTLTISTRNLVRDRFLGAAAGGYLLESSYLTEDGVVRGHVHVGCLNLAEGNMAPDLNPAPAHFAAVEDLGGGNFVDFFQIEIPALEVPGMYRCMAWSGDGSHRVPMAERANQQVAVDAVRITVTDNSGTDSD
jgi:hypothetical protein